MIKERKEGRNKGRNGMSRGKRWEKGVGWGFILDRCILEGKGKYREDERGER